MLIEIEIRFRLDPKLLSPHVYGQALVDLGLPE
jgi:hypothetical protein